MRKLSFAPLPVGVACAGGVQIDSWVYIAGGQDQTNPLASPSRSSFYAINLNAENSA